MVRLRFSVVAGLVTVGDIPMKIGIDFSSIKQDRWYEYLERFFFGGVITAATGLIAKRFGPEVAGLFLAFPAIFPATTTLIEKHQQEKKEKAGKPGVRSGRAVASIDSAGAAMGTLGLMAFGLFVWRMLPQHSAWLVLVAATFIWFGVAVAVWMLRKSIRKGRKRIPTRSKAALRLHSIAFFVPMNLCHEYTLFHLERAEENRISFSRPGFANRRHGSRTARLFVRRPRGL